MTIRVIFNNDIDAYGCTTYEKLTDFLTAIGCKIISVGKNEHQSVNAEFSFTVIGKDDALNALIETYGWTKLSERDTCGFITLVPYLAFKEELNGLLIKDILF